MAAFTPYSVQVLDGAERLRSLEATLIPAFLRLQELVCVCVTLCAIILLAGTCACAYVHVHVCGHPSMSIMCRDTACGHVTYIGPSSCVIT